MNAKTDFTVGITLPDGSVRDCGTLSEVFDGPTARRVSFSYDTSYISDPKSVAISPDLPLSKGTQFPPTHLEMFAGIRDAMPDSWGRRLVSYHARRDGKHPSRLGRTDDLHFVPNNTRQGELNFSPCTVDGEIPPISRLAEFGTVIQEFERGDDLSTPEMLELLPLGSSQGGARPKMNVHLEDGSLAIAKFPAQNDRWDVQRWEGVTAALAEQSGLPISPFRVVEVDEYTSIFVTKRFDRAGSRPIGYWSGQTILQSDDTRGVSYAELASFALFNAEDRALEGKRFFRQAAFSVLISNVDDHMRNYGMLRSSRGGWTSAPAFDLNPFPLPRSVEATPLTTDDDPRNRQLSALLTGRNAFLLSESDAIRILKEVEAGTRNWANTARNYRLGAEDITRMAGAFEHDQRNFVRDLPAPE